jgi:hypothetical protein
MDDINSDQAVPSQIKDPGNNLIPSPIPFSSIKWDHLDKLLVPGESGRAYWQLQKFQNIQLHLVELSSNFQGKEWCNKTRIAHCLKGRVLCELQNDTFFLITTGMSYIVSDGSCSHRLISTEGAQLLIIEWE